MIFVILFFPFISLSQMSEKVKRKLSSTIKYLCIAENCGEEAKKGQNRIFINNIHTCKIKKLLTYSKFRAKCSNNILIYIFNNSNPQLKKNYIEIKCFLN